MIFLWYLLIIFLNLSLIKSQSIDITQNLTNKTLDLFILDHPQITILGALTNPEHIEILNEHTNQLYRISSGEEIYLSSKSFILDLNPLLIAIKLCELGNHSHAKAIIAGRGIDGNDLTLTAISYVSDFYHIPVLTIASRENLFSDKVK
jgi:predicted NACHT family NTPase